jgi:hypothetical protein
MNPNEVLFGVILVIWGVAGWLCVKRVVLFSMDGPSS